MNWSSSTSTLCGPLCRFGDRTESSRRIGRYQHSGQSSLRPALLVLPRQSHRSNQDIEATAVCEVHHRANRPPPLSGGCHTKTKFAVECRRAVAFMAQPQAVLSTTVAFSWCSCDLTNLRWYFKISSIPFPLFRAGGGGGGWGGSGVRFAL